MAADVTLRITADDSALEPVLGELLALIERLPKPLAEITDGPFDLLECPSELVRVDIDRGSAPAGEFRVLLQPTDRLLGLVAALRARDRDLRGVEHES